MPRCEQCITADAIVQIVLANGASLKVCDACVVPCVRERASTENPVRELIGLEEMDLEEAL